MENLDVARVEECTRLLLVSRHRLVREVLALRIETSGSFVVAALEDDLARGIAEARRRAADLLLIDASCLEDGALRLLSETGHDLKKGTSSRRRSPQVSRSSLRMPPARTRCGAICTRRSSTESAS
jgi:DNA-binding NarL/FixJ family response regulator